MILPRTTQRTYKAILAAVVVLAWALHTNCSRNRGPVDSGTVNFLIEAMPTNLDPRMGTDAQSEHLDGLIFSSLLAQDAQMNSVPDLAESWETPDPVTYVFHL